MQHIWKQLFHPTLSWQLLRILAFSQSTSMHSTWDGRFVCTHVNSATDSIRVLLCVTLRPGGENDEWSSALRGIRRQPTVTHVVIHDSAVQGTINPPPHRACFLSSFWERGRFQLSFIFREFLSKKRRSTTFFYFWLYPLVDNNNYRFFFVWVCKQELILVLDLWTWVDDFWVC